MGRRPAVPPQGSPADSPADVLPDILAPGLDLVVCGSAAGAASARLGRYYAGPGNRFWPTLAEVGLTPRLLSPVEAGLLPGFGVGLTDLVKGRSGSDADVGFERADAEALRRRILECRPRYLCFNGKRAAREYLAVSRVHYGAQADTIGETRLYVAPSTSAAARRFWDVAWWHHVAAQVGSFTGIEYGDGSGR